MSTPKRKKKARMGRPPLGKNAKSINLIVRVTPAQRKALDKAAKAAGLTLSAFILRPHQGTLQGKG